MSTAKTAPRRTTGRSVIIRRNLDHPAWAGRDVAELIGGGTVTSIRTDYVTDRKVVRLSNGHEYWLSTGYQQGSEATRFEFAD